MCCKVRELRQSVAGLCVVSVSMVGIQYVSIGLPHNYRTVISASALCFNAILAFFTLWLFKVETHKPHKIYKINGVGVSYNVYRHRES